MSMEGKVGLITGGATGIGAAVCTGLAERGAAAVVIAYAHSVGPAEELAQTLTARGTRAWARRVDVKDEAQVRALVDEVVRVEGRLDYLVNSAGTTRFIPHGDLDALTDEVWDELLRTNLLGPFYAVRAAAPALRRAHGAVVSVSSISAERGTGSSIPYAVSKAGLTQLTRGLATALGPDVRLNVVAPGHVDTRWHRDHLGDEGADAAAARTAAVTPLGRVTTAEDVAAVILGLLEAPMVTGQSVVVDGGRSITY